MSRLPDRTRPRRTPGRSAATAAARAAWWAGAALVAGGCSGALETGYVPRPLGASPTERRGYYASPFTPEAQAAAQSQNNPAGDVQSMRKPGGGYRGP
ncbi:MAG: hypothetical protein JWO31_2801 [Phycisphaerales bacterium]|nr:hypothetical protein [Phycisphaerales bacterium]